jgi:carboxyl-terminal processing protease
MNVASPQPKRRPLAAMLVALAVSAACGSPSSPTSSPAQPAGAMSALASTYLDQLIGIMQNNSINRPKIDWTSFRATVVTDARSAQTIVDLYPAIRTALRLLGDGHSFYQLTAGGTISVPTRTCSPSGAGTPSLPSAVGYVKVTSFSGNTAQATAFANEIQAAIAAADRDDLIGWVVDLRGNGGGNLWPMIAGIGPVLGMGTFGYFIDPVGGMERMLEYRDGASINAGVVVVQVTAPYRLRREQPRVAVLSDNGIASSGEATLVAFRQRPDTRSFGAPTCGLSTANLGFALSDGATLQLTVVVLADRIKTRYGDSIPPDEVITDSAQVVQRAVAWLQSP